MFTPNVPATLIKMNCGFDAEGMRVPGLSYNVKIGLVKLQDAFKKSVQDVDGSASQNASEEATVVATILIPTSVTPENGDKVVTPQINLRIESVWPQYDVTGRFDHWQCDASAWSWN